MSIFWLYLIFQKVSWVFNKSNECSFYLKISPVYYKKTDSNLSIGIKLINMPKINSTTNYAFICLGIILIAHQYFFKYVKNRMIKKLFIYMPDLILRIWNNMIYWVFIYLFTFFHQSQLIWEWDTDHIFIF